MSETEPSPTEKPAAVAEESVVVEEPISPEPPTPKEEDSTEAVAAIPKRPLKWKILAPILAMIPVGGMVAMPAFYVATPEAPPEVASSSKAIVVDLHKQWLYAYEKGELVDHMPAVTGKRGKPTPTGQHAIGWKSEDYTSREYNAPMPHAMFFVVSRGIAIHGSSAIPWRWRVNRFGANLGSAGCVSLAPENAKRLFEWAPPKTPVYVTTSLDPSVMPQPKGGELGSDSKK
tara:strand:+ start:4766 stop:5458 length:693 start_codon:yes stop_codon:yes gene_type:complete